MKLTRGKRIALELLGPPLLGALILGTSNALYAIWTQPRTDSLGESLSQIGAYLLFAVIGAYMIAGIPSIICTCVIEWRFAQGLNPATWRAVRLFSALGFVSGNMIAVYLTDFRWGIGTLWLGTVSVGVGLLVGFLLGILIKRWSTKN